MIPTTDAILNNIHRNEAIAIDLLDMSIALDRINHDIPLLKLQSVDFSQSTLS